MAVIARAGNIIVVGLEEVNLEKLRSGQPFHHHMKEVGAPFELLIFWGKDYAALVESFEGMVGPDTQVTDCRGRPKH